MRILATQIGQHFTPRVCPNDRKITEALSELDTRVRLPNDL